MSVYLDNAATTKPYPFLREVFAQHIDEGWYNPSAMYPPAVACEAEAAAAKRLLCAVIGADPVCCLLTSCGTEAANTVILRGWRPAGGKKRHFITSAYEHPCVEESMKALEAQGHEVSYIRPDADGTIHAEAVAAAVKADTALVSIMHVNNETGAKNDICAIAAAVKGKNPAVLMHSDGVQGYVKCALDFGASQIDYYTVSAHKLHAPKGTGLLFYKKGAPLSAYILGGGQERALRSGTENTFGLAAFAAACREYSADIEAKRLHMRALGDRLKERLEGKVDYRCFTPQDAAPHILNLAFPGLRGEVMLHLLEAKGIYVSTGSACSSNKKRHASRVHQALGIAQELAECVIRISFCPENTFAEIDMAAEAIIDAYGCFGGRIRR